MVVFDYMLPLMSEAVSIAAPSPSLESASQPSSLRETRRYLLAAFFSAIVPGVGQLFLGRRRKGSILLILSSALLFGFWPVRLLRLYPGLITLFSAWISLYIYAVGSLRWHDIYSSKEALQRVAGSDPSVYLPDSQPRRSNCDARLRVRKLQHPFNFHGKNASARRSFCRGHERSVTERRGVIVFLRNDIFYVKRVIALTGDSIQGKNRIIFVNGEEQHEPYVQHVGPQWPDGMNNFGPVAIPSGKCFVMGDSRDIGLDSRSPEFGLVENGSIVGKPLYVFGSDRVGASIR